MWGVPVDHEMFKEINQAQWLWYYHNFITDGNEKFEHDRDIIEYHASFIEPEAVRKIREARDQAIMVPDAEFMGGLEQMFGRALGSAERPKETEINKVNIGKVLSEYKQLQPNKLNGFSYKEWLNIKLE